MVDTDELIMDFKMFLANLIDLPIRIDLETLLKEHNHGFLHRLLNSEAFQSHWMATFHSLLSLDGDLKHLDGPKSISVKKSKYHQYEIICQNLTRLLLAECELEVLS